jgi:hypothetical protein
MNPRPNLHIQIQIQVQPQPQRLRFLIPLPTAGLLSLRGGLSLVCLWLRYLLRLFSDRLPLSVLFEDTRINPLFVTVAGLSLGAARFATAAAGRAGTGGLVLGFGRGFCFFGFVGVKRSALVGVAEGIMVLILSVVVRVLFVFVVAHREYFGFGFSWPGGHVLFPVASVGLGNDVVNQQSLL